MRNYLILFSFLLTTGFSFGQGGIMLEAGGPAGYFSVNFKYTAFQMVSSSIEGRIGYGTYRLAGVKGQFHPDIIIPVGLAYRHTKFLRWSIGGGITFSGIQKYEGNDLKTVWGVAGFESISFQFVDKAHFQSNVTAYLLNEKQKPFRPWGGVSFTYLF